ncbi:ADP-ribosyltransferase [Roseateles sp.]|uniref:VG15 protein n=1 Tax=Roseateles sp. TaxID=1971397 RepID=UPI002F41F5C3
MPSPEANRLTLAHQHQCELVADVVEQGVRGLARRARTADIDAWYNEVLPDLLALVSAGFINLRQLARRYLTRHAGIEGRTVTPVLAQFNLEQAHTSLRVTGPVAFKTHMSATGDVDASRQAMASAMAGAAQRLAMTGSRKTIMATVERADEIVGWRRVPDADPCAWCALLAGRGAVYKSAETALSVVGRAGRPRGEGKRALGLDFHDRDQCTAEPLYEDEDEPEYVQDLQDQWNEVTAGKSGKQAIRAWREYWDNRPQQQPAPSFDERVDAALTGAQARAAAPLSALRESSLRDPKALRPAESDAIDQYKGAKFGAINDSLRGTGDQADADVGDLVDAMDAAFARSPLASDVVVHRGIGNPAVVFGDAAGVNLAGAEWTEQAYVSTSTDRSVIEGFMFGLQKMAMRILVPRGVGAIELSNERFESELLLQRGLRMRVVSDTGPGTDPREIEVEVVR